MESKYKIGEVLKLIVFDERYPVKFRCEVYVNEQPFATVYGSTAQECESRAMLIVKAEGVEAKINTLLEIIKELDSQNRVPSYENCLKIINKNS